jgi:2-polyprenyl-3-methyl-5-hydroxy-6-metoxy-1,4-benzoquinol methylase
MIDLAIVGRDWDPEGSEEFRFGWKDLERRLREACNELVMATDGDDLWTQARQAVLERPTLADEAKVLLLRHPHALLAPHCLSLLEQALDREVADGASIASVVQGSDSGLPWAQQPPDYCTVRGMERYAQSIPPDTTFEADLRTEALTTLTRAASLRRSTNPQGLAVTVVPGAFAHDYSAYHLGNREEVIPLIPMSVRRILDVGGGAGRFLQAVKTHLACETHLAEFSEQACRAASSRVDRIWQGDFLTRDIDAGFDCITFLDVLEHAEHPLQWLARARSLLAPDGCIVASIPNVGHWSVIADLLEGRWDYAPVGIHCITHLRFFTRYGIEQMFSEAGFAIDCVRATELPAPSWWQVADFAGRLVVDNKNLDAYAYLVRATPKPIPR